MDGDDDFDIRNLIKTFLSKQVQFRNPEFDPAPFIISILKQKEVNHELMIQKQNSLIQLQNEAQDIIEEISSEYSEQFLKLLDIPTCFGEEIQKLKSNISIVKKKVKETKSLLQNTQKDIEQIHYNCLYNKLIYRKLKEIQLRLQQYEAASLALKNNQFMKCSMNLPFIQGNSILQSTLASRSQILRLRMMSRAIEQINLFMYFSPKIVTPSSNIMLERAYQEEQKAAILNWNEHQPFYRRYQLFKKAHCFEYLQKIWKFDDVQRKQGKIAMVYDIIKGAMNLGKITEISNSIKLNAPKLISNIFYLLKCFYIRDNEELLTSVQQPRWFIDKTKQIQAFLVFVSNILNISGVIFRKAIIIRKIYQEFQVFDESFHSGSLYKLIFSEITKILQLICFPALMKMKEQDHRIEGNPENILMQFQNKLCREKNYIFYGCIQHTLRKCLKIIVKSVKEIQQKQFSIDPFFEDQSALFQTYNHHFYLNFHKDFIKTIEEIFNKDGRSFTIQVFDVIVEEKQLNNDEIKFMKGYRSEDKKSIKEYVYMLSFLKAVEEYFQQYKLSQEQYLKYCLFFLSFFYLKLNYHFIKHIFSNQEWKKILQAKKTDKKLKQKEQNFCQTYRLLVPDNFVKEKKIYGRESAKLNEENEFLNFKMLDRLKIFKIQNQMLLSFCCHFFPFASQYKNSKDSLGFNEIIEKLQPANYEDNVKAKLTRIWDSLPDSQKYLKQSILIIVQKIIVLHLCINAKIFLETGVY